MRVTVHSTGASLRPGDVIDLFEHGPCVVELVNECRARVRPKRRVPVTIKPAFGKERSFTRPAGSLDISPNSDVRIVSRHGR